ncbi:MAG TPA: hypothetical protein VL754_16750 [Verrucomicrobiae bacterium]|nr:hypothetical protein [Verrucomicrobiae bacterium]
MSRRRSSRRRKRRVGGEASPPRTQHHYSWVKPLKARPPEPFFDAGGRATLCPETALLCAVLEDAFECLYSAKDPQVAADAREWFFAERGPALFSFLSICEALELDAEDIRRRLRSGHRIGVDAELKKKAKNATGAAAARPRPLKSLGAGRPRTLARK